jgi:hypothetical protein
VGTYFKALGKAEQAAVEAYVTAEYDKLLFQQPNSYVSRNAEAGPEAWQDRLREVIAADPERVRAITEVTRREQSGTKGAKP